MIQQEMSTTQPEIWDELSLEERVWFYKRWKRARWSQVKFCTKHRLPLEKFREFCKEIESCLIEEDKIANQPGYPAQDSSGFCEIELMKPAPLSPTVMTLELCFPNQIKARIEADEQQFAFLLKEMLHATSIVR